MPDDEPKRRSDCFWTNTVPLLFVFQYDTEPRIGGETPYVAMTANADVRTAIAVSFGRVNMFSKVLTGVSIAVYSNIKNGCWLTNFEPMQKVNNKLCDRYLFNVNYQPCKFENVMNKMLNMRKRNYKLHP